MTARRQDRREGIFLFPATGYRDRVPAHLFIKDTYMQLSTMESLFRLTVAFSVELLTPLLLFLASLRFRQHTAPWTLSWLLTGSMLLLLFTLPRIGALLFSTLFSLPYHGTIALWCGIGTRLGLLLFAVGFFKFTSQREQW